MTVYVNANWYLVPYQIDGNDVWNYIFFDNGSQITLKEVSTRAVNKEPALSIAGRLGRDFEIQTITTGAVSKIVLQRL